MLLERLWIGALLHSNAAVVHQDVSAGRQQLLPVRFQQTHEVARCALTAPHGWY
jgi:hypothetical protein